MRRINKGGVALALALSVASVALIPAPASAQFGALQPVIDIKAIGQMAQQLTTQIQMLQQQIQQYQNMVANTASLPAQQWGQTMQSINSVNNLLRQAQSLSYQGANIEQQIRAKYSGYSGYSSNGINSATMQAKYRQWSDDTNSSLQATMKALGMQNDQLSDEDALMRQLESMGDTAQGRMQAAQVGNQLAAQAVRQTQKLRQLQMMQLQMQASWMAQQQDKANVQSAAGAKAYQRSNYPVQGGRAF